MAGAHLALQDLVNVQLCKMLDFVCQVDFLGAHHLHLLLQRLDLVCRFFLLFRQVQLTLCLGLAAALFFILFSELEEVPGDAMEKVLGVNFSSIKLLYFLHVVADPGWQGLKLAKEVLKLLGHLDSIYSVYFISFIQMILINY